jgi:hypothetical protein
VEELNAQNGIALPLPQLDLIHLPSLLREGARRADETQEREVAGEVIVG